MHNGDMTTQSIDLVMTPELIATIEENAIEVCKADELDRDQWLKTRKPYIGGSEAAASLGLSPWRSQYSLFVDKTTEMVSDEDNEYMRWGRRLEEAIGLGISEDTGIPVVRYPYMMASKKWPWAAVNVDFLAPQSVVEVKNVSGQMSHGWDDGAVPAIYGLQGQHACAILGLPGVHFFPLIGGHEGRPVYVARDDDLIENLMEGERKFWDLVKNNTPPEVDGSASTTKALKAMFVNPDAETEIELPESALRLLERRALSKAVIKEQNEVIAEVENQLFAMLGNYEIGVINGVTVVSWKKQYRAGYVVGASEFRKIHVPKQRVAKK